MAVLDKADAGQLLRFVMWFLRSIMLRLSQSQHIQRSRGGRRYIYRRRRRDIEKIPAAAASPAFVSKKNYIFQRLNGMLRRRKYASTYMHIQVK
jgi:hypothetical protein